MGTRLLPLAIPLTPTTSAQQPTADLIVVSAWTYTADATRPLAARKPGPARGRIAGTSGEDAHPGNGGRARAVRGSGPGAALSLTSPAPPPTKRGAGERARLRAPRLSCFFILNGIDVECEPVERLNQMVRAAETRCGYLSA